MARGFKRKGQRFVARLDPVERGLVVGLMEQVRDLLQPDGPAAAGDGDAFDQIVAGLGGSGWGVSVSAEDQAGQASTSAGDLGGRDPALERLLPVANREDEQVAAEFRRLTEDGLRSRKASTLATALSALEVVADERVELDRDQATAVLVALTDVRLVLGERLGLRTDEDFDLLESQVRGLGDDDPTVYALAVYDFLTWLQETLAHALMPKG